MLCFAVIGFGSGGLVRRLGLHRSAVALLVLVAAGLVVRSLLEDTPLFLAATVFTLAGAAVGNVILPPLAWAMVACFGAQSAAAYAQFGWYPEILTDDGAGAGWLGVLVSPSSVPLLWSVLLGLGGGSSLLTQGLGYLVAGLGPFGVGALHDATGSWTAPLVALIASSAVIAAAGDVVSRPRMLEDTLR
ncbi:hypothetical protein [Aeromicrobium duanguangcaii]|uniref:hypothetical protein n=1 Tax=Aeromicrobium duanguangcaii TaxID=2968086 RepID=UPI002016C285|nr:hypothetical protein [Aeromicrobium duanguangcaii]MCL3836450.1 hypothetical protein [Aeromicrobium duanguangcaii]